MADTTTTIITGNLTDDPELRFTTSGTAVAIGAVDTGTADPVVLDVLPHPLSRVAMVRGSLASGCVHADYRQGGPAVAG